MLLSIVNDYEKITGKNSIMSACNLSYRLKRSGPYIYKLQKDLNNKSPQLGRQQTLLKIKGKCSTGSSAVDFCSRIMKKEKKEVKMAKRKRNKNWVLRRRK